MVCLVMQVKVINQKKNITILIIFIHNNLMVKYFQLKKKKKAESYSEEKNKTSDTHKNIFKTKW